MLILAQDLHIEQGLSDMMNCLGLDCGTRKTGIALGSLLTRTARPLASLDMKSHEVELLLPFVREWQIGFIVIGDPGNAENNQKLKQHIVTLKKELSKAIPSCQLIDWSEELTSQEARMVLKDFPALQKKYTTDAIAAMLMLQSYLDLC